MQERVYNTRRYRGNAMTIFTDINARVVRPYYNLTPGINDAFNSGHFEGERVGIQFNSIQFISVIQQNNIYENDL